MDGFARPSLSARLLLLTAAFVMIAEVLIYTPSIARFRLVWLQEKLAAAHLASLAVEATPDRMLSAELSMRLLDHVDAYVVDLYRGLEHTHMLSRVSTPDIDAVYDLEEDSPLVLIGDAFATLAQPAGRVIQVFGQSPKDGSVAVHVVMREEPLRDAMIAFSERILALSIVISLITGALVFLSLRYLIVRPVRRLTDSLMAFRRDPENPASDPPATSRRDEIGAALRELAHMQADLRAALRQKTRLATLGAAVAKVNHDLRNMLASATLMSDRLLQHPDAQVRKVAERLIAAIDRAVTLCTQTLTYAQGAPPIARARLDLAGLVDALAREFRDAGRGLVIDNQIPQGLAVEADGEQLARVFDNLAGNAAEAGARRLSFRAEIAGDTLVLLVVDDGPGIPPDIRPRLFEPFAGSSKRRGTGLGLAIARELVAAHGGSIALADSGAGGTAFRIELPAVTRQGAARP